MLGLRQRRLASGTFRGKSTILNAAISLSSMFGGLGIRLLGLTWYESKYMNRSVKLHHRFGVRKNVVPTANGEIRKKTVKVKLRLSLSTNQL